MSDTLPPTLLANPAPGAPKRPTARFMRAHPAHMIALGLGSGLSPLAPGTAGTLWAWLAFVVMQPWLSDIGWAWLLVATLLLVGLAGLTIVRAWQRG